MKNKKYHLNKLVKVLRTNIDILKNLWYNIGYKNNEFGKCFLLRIVKIFIFLQKLALLKGATSYFKSYITNALKVIIKEDVYEKED